MAVPPYLWVAIFAIAIGLVLCEENSTTSSTTKPTPLSTANLNATTHTTAAPNNTTGTPFSNRTTTPSSNINGTFSTPYELRPCLLRGFDAAAAICMYSGTNTTCDPCGSLTCSTNQECLVGLNCTAECACADKQTHMVNGSCISLCDPNPCANGGTCRLTNDTARIDGFMCNCTEHFKGPFCKEWKNYCLEEQPPACPKGPFICEMSAPGEPKCECATGYYHNTTDNSCVKVGQTMNIVLKFNGTFYHELYNDFSSEWFRNASLELNQTFSDIYSNLLIGMEYHHFSEGSLIVNLTTSLKVADNGYPEDNDYMLRSYIVNCMSREWKNDRKHKCFGSLGDAFIPFHGVVSKDLRCDGIFCPPTTECVASSSSTGPVRCGCQKGYNSTGVNRDNMNRFIDICQDIDECGITSTICPETTACKNLLGGYECIETPCARVTCPGYASCVSDRADFYTCECSWFYSAGCTSVWPLVMLLLAILFFILLVLLIVALIISRLRARTGLYRVDPVGAQTLPFPDRKNENDRQSAYEPNDKFGAPNIMHGIELSEVRRKSTISTFDDRHLLY